MQLSTRGRYAVMAMVDLAMRTRCAASAVPQMATPGSSPGACPSVSRSVSASVAPSDLPGACPSVCLSEIAASQCLSLAYLEQLFGKLRRAGLVTSMRGPGGGYRLARPASAVPIAAIIAAVDEAIRATRCEVGEPGCMAGAGPDGTAGRCQTHDLWAELGRQISLFLEGVTLADVIEGQVAGRAAPVAAAQAVPTIAAPAAGCVVAAPAAGCVVAASAAGLAAE